MAQETFTKEQFWTELDTIGEEEVRARIATGTYSTVNKKRQLAEDWLRRGEQSRLATSISEQTQIARSAMVAAREAASAAREAADAAREAVVEAREQSRVVKATNTKATIALVIAAISVAVAVALYFLKGAF